MTQPFIHHLSDVQSTEIGINTRIWQFVVVLAGAKIGNDCNICSHCLIENDVVIGDRVTVKCGVQLWDGLRVDDDVFIGPNVSFANDKRPKSKNGTFKQIGTWIKAGASIGAGASLLPGITIGEGATVGAGSVVTKDVAPGITVVGNPARQINQNNAMEIK
jgi:UDP-2-acetamido-3-amino-2,3-dideoxy-glucuronate N-acetyltransferase